MKTQEQTSEKLVLGDDRAGFWSSVLVCNLCKCPESVKHMHVSIKTSAVSVSENLSSREFINIAWPMTVSIEP